MSRPVLKTILTDTLEIAYEEDGQTYGKPVISCIASLTTRPPIPVVPEAKAGWVLIPFVGAVLIFSWRQLSRAKA